MHQDHARATAMRADVEKIRELADLVDLDLDARLFAFPGRRVLGQLSGWLFPENLGLQAAQVRMIAAEVPAARIALVAGPFSGCLAKEQLRQIGRAHV